MGNTRKTFLNIHFDKIITIFFFKPFLNMLYTPNRSSSRNTSALKFSDASKHISHSVNGHVITKLLLDVLYSNPSFFMGGTINFLPILCRWKFEFSRSEFFSLCNMCFLYDKLSISCIYLSKISLAYFQ